MNIGETSATLPVPDTIVAAAAPAPAVGAAGFADRLAEAMGDKPASLAGKPDLVEGDAVFAVAAGDPDGADTVAFADVLAAQAALSCTVATPEAKPCTLPQAATVADLPAEVEGAMMAMPEPEVPVELIASGGKPVTDGVKGLGDKEETEAAPAEDDDGTDVPQAALAEATPVPVAAPIAVSVMVAVPAVVTGAVAEAGPFAVKPQREAGRALSTSAALSVTLGTGMAQPEAKPVAGAAKPAAEAGVEAEPEGAVPAEKDIKSVKSAVLATVTAAEPVVVRAPEASAVVAPAVTKAVVADAKATEPAAPLVQQAPLPVTQSVDRTVAQPLRTDLPGWEQVLSERIAAELTDDGQEIELSLSPEKLGPLRIKLEMVDGLAQVRIITATPEAARVFTEAQHRLTEGLQRAGIDLGSQSAESGRQGSQPDDRATPRNRMTEFLTHSRQIEAGDAPALRRAAAGLVNLMA